MTNRLHQILATMILALAAIQLTPAFAQALPADNDPQSTYASGTFALPEQITEKQKYVIVIKVGGAADRIIELPDGSNVLRLVPAGRPIGNWRWSYFVRPLSKVAIEVLNYTQASETVALEALRGPNDSKLVFLEWKHNPTVKSYRLVTQPIRLRGDGKEFPGKETTVPTEPLEDQIEATSQSEKFGVFVKVTPGQVFNWRVEGLDDRKDVIAASTSRRMAIEAPWFLKMSKAGFKLQRAETLLAKESNVTNALLSFANVSSAAKGTQPAVHDAKTVSTEFAVIWQGKNQLTNSDHSLAYAGSFEARLNSQGTAKANDVMRARYGFGLLLAAPYELDTVGNLKWERDRKTKIEKGLVEFRATPIGNPFAVLLPRNKNSDLDPYGNVLPGKELPIQIAILPSLGFDVGKTLSSKIAGQTKDTEVRYVAALRLDVEMPWLANVLQLPRVSGTTTATARYLPREDSDKRKDFVTSGLDFWLGPNLALSGTYKVGRDAPAFDWGRNFTIGISGKF
jgi:hypothetical protein